MRPSDYARKQAQIDQLSRFGLFRDVNDTTMNDLREHCEIFHPQRHEPLWVQGQEVTFLFIVLRGHIKVIQKDRSGRSFILYLLGPEEITLSLETLSGAPPKTEAVAVERSVVVGLCLERFRAYLGSDRQLFANVVEHTAARHAQLLERLSELTPAAAEVRMAVVLLRFADSNYFQPERSVRGSALTIPLTRLELAQLLGLRERTIYSVLRRWQREGWIAGTLDGFRIFDWRRLEEISGEGGYHPWRDRAYEGNHCDDEPDGARIVE